MNKRLLTLGMGLFAAATASLAQVTFPVKIGFEDADKSDLYHSKYANNVGLSEFGDWVNPHADTDNWIEQNQGEQVSGEYCFMAQNTDKLNPWDRGFKLTNLPIKENTPYRMSFWIKGEAGNVVTAWLSKGVEQLDKSFISSSNSGEYGINQRTMSGEWEHMSFVAFYENAAPYNNWLTNTSWAGGATVGDCIPESLWAGAGVNDSNKDKTYREFFNGAVPEEFFAIVNMFDGGTYFLDDIVIEEGVYFNQATGNGDVIKLDFGYDTNIKTLVAATKKGVCLMLDKEQFKVNGADGSELAISSVEAHADGFVYIFLEEPQSNKATVSFTPNDECPLEYAGNRQPTSDFTQVIKVKGFQNEPVYDDENIYEESHNTALPELDSCYPENGSFDLPTSTNEWTFVFDTPVDPEGSSAVLENESGKVGDLALSQGADEKTIVAKYNGTLKNGSYIIKMEIANNAGDASFYDDETNPAYKFSIGATGFDPDQSSEIMFDAKFDECDNNTVPTLGRLTFGKDAEGNDAVLTPGEGRGSGARLFTDFAAGGQFTAALYSRDWDGNGQYEIGLGEEAIELNEGNHKLGFTWAQWKEGATISEVTIFKVNEEGEEDEIVWQNEGSYTGAVNVNGGKPVVEGAQDIAINFNVDEPGRYGVRFKGTGEWLIANINIEYLPNIAGIDSKTKLYKSYLAALTKYEDNCDTERYNDKDMDVLYKLIQKYEDFNKWSTDLGMTAPSQYEAAAKELDEAVAGLNEFIKLIDQYDALRVEDGTIAQVLDNTAESKVAKLECWSVLKASFEKYKDQTLTDKDQLRDAVALLQGNLIEVRRWNGEVVKDDGTVENPWAICGDMGLKALTKRIDIAYNTIEAMNPEYTEADAEVMTRAAEAMTDDDVLANQLKKIATLNYYKAMTNAETAKAFFEPKGVEDEEGNYEQTSDGTYDFTFFLKNPFIYTITNRTDANPGNSLEAIEVGTEEEPVTIHKGDVCPGWTVSDGTGDWSTGWSNYKGLNMPVECMFSNWGGSFTVSQSIEDLPAGLYILKGGVNERDAYADDSYFFWQTSADDDIVTMEVPSTGQNWNTGNISSARRNAIFDQGQEVTEEGEEPEADADPIEILDGKLTIGAHAGGNSHIFINNFQIFLVGGSSTYDYNKGYTDDVKSINNKLQSVAVFDMNGRQIVRAAKGVNIVKRTYSDGSVKVGKVLVK